MNRMFLFEILVVGLGKEQVFLKLEVAKRCMKDVQNVRRDKPNMVLCYLQLKGCSVHSEQTIWLQPEVMEGLGWNNIFT